MDYVDKEVVVTGGGGALGRAVVERLLAEGAHVHVPAFGHPDAQRLTDLASERLRVEIGVDLGDEDAVAGFYAGVGSLWASVHLVGGFVFGKLVDAELSDFERMMNMNARTAWLGCREAVRAFGDGPGRIVNVAAKPTLVAGPDTVTYAMSKGAVATLTRCLGAELAPQGVLVNAVAPSIMDTAANRSAMPDADHESWPTVAEVAATIAWLASPDNTLTWGDVVPVYGRAG